MRHLLKKRWPDCRQAGFSLVELTLVIMVVGFIALLTNNLPGAISSVGKSHFSSLAKDITVQKIEDIRSQTYDNLGSGTTPISDNRLSQLPTGSGSVTVSDCPISICKSGEVIKQVTVEVDWLEDGKSKNIKITTFVAKGGLK